MMKQRTKERVKKSRIKMIMKKKKKIWMKRNQKTMKITIRMTKNQMRILKMSMKR